MRKSKFNLTHLHSTTLDPGYLVPFLLQPTLPNDSYRIGLSTFIRAQPMLAPLMHEVRLFTQYWFVPYRLLWDNWEEFITGGPELASTPAFPTITLDADDAKVGSLTDYLGFPLVEGLEVSAMPYRAMAEIWNARYRDEDLQQEVPVSYDDGADTTTSRELLSPAFSKDYFTTARPFTQRGGDIIVPVSDAVATGTNSGKRVSFFVLVGQCSKQTTGAGALTTCSPNMSPNSIRVAVSNWFKANLQQLDTLTVPADMELSAQGSTFVSAYTIADFDAHLALRFNNVYGGVNVEFGIWVFPTEVVDFESPNPLGEQIDVPISGTFTCPSVWYRGNDAKYFAFGDGSGYYLRFINLETGVFNTPIGNVTFDQTKNFGTAVLPVTQSVSGFTIRDLRASSALQRYAERSLEYGNRYEEFIQREFGIKPRDYRIQRPEYLGGGRGILNISEVLQTAESADTGVGTMRGHGVASISQRNIRFRCPEHGLILGLLSIRPRSVYTQGIDREWLKRSRLDFFTPELASIGMQEVLQQELYAQPNNVGEVFAYSQRYQEYRYHKPVVTGEFRDNLSFWNMARLFNTSPNLNDEFINMKYSAADFKRPFQIQDDGAHSFVVMLKNHIRAYRPIPKRAKNVLR